MTHKTLTLSLCAAILAACGGKSTTPAEPESPVVGAANPASEFCVQQGGTLEMRKDEQGNEYAMCHLPNGEVIEEWEFFRKHNGQ